MTKIDFLKMADLLTKAAETLTKAATDSEKAEEKQQEPQSEYLTIEQAAKYLSLKRSALYRLTHLKQIPFFKPTGKAVYFKVDDLQAWVSKKRVKSIEEIEAEAALLLVRKR